MKGMVFLETVNVNLMPSWEESTCGLKASQVNLQYIDVSVGFGLKGVNNVASS